MKGAAAAIGAVPLSEIAKETEFAARAGDSKAVGGHLETLYARLDECTRSIESWRSTGTGEG